MSLEQQVRQFNETYNVKTSDKPKLPNDIEATLMHNLILEELMELNEAIDDGDVVGIADALADIVYVTAQQAVTHGYPIDELVREVQRSNMSKLGEDGRPIIRSDGKVLKGPNYSPPNLRDILKAKGASV